MPQDSTQTAAQQIEARRNRFKAEWLGGRKPRIEDYLGSAQGQTRAALFLALLAAEVEVRQGQGERLDPAAYRQRFPDHSPAISQVLNEALQASKVQQPAGNGASHATLDTVQANRAVPTMSYGGTLDEAVKTAMPAKVARFEVLSLLGEGAFGKVYRARDPQLDREVAIKVPQPGVLDSQRDLERFQREAKAAATIQHPNICPVYEIGQDAGSHYIVMAYVPGQSLAAHLAGRKAPMPARQAAQMVRKLALALLAAHDKGIVHRDLKPGNILIDGDRKELIITDFGLARRTRADEAQLTQSGAIMGTPSYMAPEQARGDAKAVGPWSDVYSLGVILYEMLAGQRPFRGSVAEVIGKLLHVEPEPPSKHRAGIDSAIEAICLRAIAKDPEKRYRSMKDLAAALAGYLKGAAQADGKPPSETETMPVESASRGSSRTQKDRDDERRAETEALVKAAAAGARMPFWAWLAGAGFMAVVVLLGIIFFARTPTTTVLVQIDVDLKDKTLSFFMDGKPIPAEELEKPIELKVGEHELLVKRNDDVIRRYRFSVKKEGGPRIELKEEEPMPKPGPEPAVEPEYKPLFNGKDLTGWKTHPESPGNWKVENGLLIGRGPNKNHLFTDRDDYTDFHFLVEVKINAKGNSGQDFRCTFGPGGIRPGYEAQIDNGSHPNKTGTLYILPSQAGSYIKKVLVPPDTWFTQEVIARGNRFIIKVNNEVVTDYVDQKSTYSRGHLALQVYDTETEVQFKRVLVRELKPGEEDGFTSLFNGKDMTEWVKPDGTPGAWKVQDGYMEVTRGSIQSRQQLPLDFELHAEFWIPRMANARGQGRGNSGIFLHGQHEIQILDNFDNPGDVKPEHSCGALYGLVGVKPGGVKPPETWQTFDVICRSPRTGPGGVVTTPGRVTVVLNGVKVIDDAEFSKVVSTLVPGNKLGQPGPIVLQDHGSAVRFRNLRYRPLPAAEGGPAGFVPLFNGTDLAGWEGQPGIWQVKDGAIIASTFPDGSKLNTFLCSKQTFKDFELEFDAKVRGTNNSGVMFRSELHDRENFWLKGVKCDLGERSGWGTLVTYDGRNGGVLKSARGTDAQKAAKADDFNRVQVRCVGQKVAVRINGELVHEPQLAELAAQGVIGFQLRYGPPTEVSLKNIRIRELK